ncbi:hypothetical protein [Mycobacterium sp.]|jgi:hypothetical protein|uniref:hypothetical protein n=1 Tax=Mycobacterium sp. TaxID=1785 RepID=UPI0039C9D705
MRTAVAEKPGVAFPICAPSFCRDLVVAVSGAGGLRILGEVAHSALALSVEGKWCGSEWLATGEARTQPEASVVPERVSEFIGAVELFDEVVGR